MNKMEAIQEYIEQQGYTDAQIESASLVQFRTALQNAGIISDTKPFGRVLCNTVKRRILRQRKIDRHEERLATIRTAVVAEYPNAEMELNFSEQKATIWFTGKPEEIDT